MLRVQFLIDAQPSCSNGAVRFIVRLDIDLCSVARIGFEEFTSYALCTYRMFDAHAVAVEFSLVCRKFIEDERSSRSTPEEMSTRWAELRNSLHVTFDAGYIYIYIYIYMPRHAMSDAGLHVEQTKRMFTQCALLPRPRAPTKNTWTTLGQCLDWIAVSPLLSTFAPLSKLVCSKFSHRDHVLQTQAERKLL